MATEEDNRRWAEERINHRVIKGADEVASWRNGVKK